MSQAREQVLARIKSALSGNAATESTGTGVHQGESRPVPLGKSHPKTTEGQADRDQLWRSLSSELTRVKASVYTAANVESVARSIVDIAAKCGATSIVGSHFPLIDDRRVTEALEAAGIKLMNASAADTNERFLSTAAEATVGLTGVDYAVADTGSLVLLSGDGKPRSASLLPPVHIAVVKPGQILPGLPELFEQLDSIAGGSPSAVTLITGPSRTADIELTLVVGVHGPQELHVIIETESGE